MIYSSLFLDANHAILEFGCGCICCVVYDYVDVNFGKVERLGELKFSSVTLR